ncbi:MAG TPA: glycosyltransferase family 2 protein [Abditibacteriaceae bacterium]|jgi:glycosyltransferase involved in cell wall biosynthesis
MSLEISVIIPTYNRGRVIQTTVESVLLQNIDADLVEVIIVDDGSTDNTWDVLQMLYGTNPRVRLFRTENSGVARARNFGLKQARGEFIAYLDHDDVWLPDKLKLQHAEITKNPDVGVVYCNWVAVDETGNEMPSIIQFQRHWWWQPAEGNVFPWILLPHPYEIIRNPIVSMSVPLMRTAALRDIGGFDAQLVPSDDWDLWIRLAQKTHFSYAPQVLVHYVHHSLQQHKQMHNAYSSVIKICRKHKVSWHLHPWVRWKQEMIIRYCLAFMNFPEAKNALAKSNYYKVFFLATRAAFWRPDILITRRWSTLLYRALTRQSKPY